MGINQFSSIASKRSIMLVKRNGHDGYRNFTVKKGKQLGYKIVVNRNKSDPKLNKFKATKRIDYSFPRKSYDAVPENQNIKWGKLFDIIIRNDTETFKTTLNKIRTAINKEREVKMKMRINHKRYSAARAEGGRSFSRLMTDSPVYSSSKGINCATPNKRLNGRMSFNSSAELKFFKLSKDPTSIDTSSPFPASRQNKLGKINKGSLIKLPKKRLRIKGGVIPDINISLKFYSNRRLKFNKVIKIRDEKESSSGRVSNTSSSSQKTGFLDRVSSRQSPDKPHKSSKLIQSLLQGVHPIFRSFRKPSHKKQKVFHS